MIRHVVTFKFKTGQDRGAAATRLREALVPLRDLIPGVQSLEVGIDDQSVSGHWDAVLISVHDSSEALAEYQGHPDHRKALAVVAELVEAKSVVDYEVR
ncbi:Dabb family protein [Tessaracoccus sp. MC1756]|uniref:Dabb family protein n=1 Tax=Tessaracoccus sp. MC1756 TaxID=2760311 RepID=UPI00160242B8|nr:Dabb family protein [Tessaracoccus sp. MC1756]MBB1510932.1 Dabb family protein [Tessaracoccus sp. MC1756]